MSNIYARNIDLEDLGRTQLRQPKRGGTKDSTKVIEASSFIIDDAAKDGDDKKLLLILHDYLMDMLQNCYNTLIEELYG